MNDNPCRASWRWLNRCGRGRAPVIDEGHLSSSAPKFPIWSGRDRRGHRLPQGMPLYRHRWNEGSSSRSRRRCWHTHRTWVASALGEIRWWRKGPHLLWRYTAVSPALLQGWTYGFNGTLLKATQMQVTKNFSKSGHHDCNPTWAVQTRQWAAELENRERHEESITGHFVQWPHYLRWLKRRYQW